MTIPARRDLREVFRRLETEVSWAFAVQYVRRFDAGLLAIQQFPRSRPLRPEFGRSTRVAFHQKYGIFYRIRRDRIEILRILHAARDLSALSREGAFR